MTALFLLPASVVAKLAPVAFAQTGNQRASLTSLVGAAHVLDYWKRVALAVGHAATGTWSRVRLHS